MRKRIVLVMLAALWAASMLTTPNGVAAQTATPSCRDGELVLRVAADGSDLTPRIPVGLNGRIAVVEISWPGAGFAGLNRAIVVLPRVGDVWEANLTGLKTLSIVGYCGDNATVAEWAVSAHVPSLLQASRNKKGQEPQPSEVGVYLVNYEQATLLIVKPGPTGQAEEVLSLLDVSFHEGGSESAVPLVIKGTATPAAPTTTPVATQAAG